MATIFVYAGGEQIRVELPSVLIISSVCFLVLCVLQVYPIPEYQDWPLCLGLGLFNLYFGVTNINIDLMESKINKVERQFICNNKHSK